MVSNDDIFRILRDIQEDVTVTKTTLITLTEENKELKKVTDKISSDLLMYKRKCRDLEMKNFDLIKMSKNVERNSTLC